MSKTYKTYEQIPKRTRNAIRQRIKSIVGQHGFEEFRMTANKYVEEIIKRRKLKNEIADKEKELEKLKKSAK